MQQQSPWKPECARAPERANLFNGFDARRIAGLGPAQSLEQQQKRQTLKAAFAVQWRTKGV
jgi:hypothetical protein